MHSTTNVINSPARSLRNWTEQEIHKRIMAKINRNFLLAALVGYFPSSSSSCTSTTPPFIINFTLLRIVISSWEYWIKSHQRVSNQIKTHNIVTSVSVSRSPPPPPPCPLIMQITYRQYISLTFPKNQLPSDYNQPHSSKTTHYKRTTTVSALS